MMLTKEGCERALTEIEDSLCELEETKTGVVVYCLFDENLEIVKQLIEEHFSNPPLKWEEIKEGDFVFDKDFNGLGGEWLKIYVKFINGFGEKVLECGACGSGDVQTRTYKDDRFYRKKVEE